MMLQNLELRKLNCWRCSRIAPELFLNREVLGFVVDWINIYIRLHVRRKMLPKRLHPHFQKVIYFMFDSYMLVIIPGNL